MARWSRSRPLGWPVTGEDWHTLLEFCGLVGTLIVDEDGVYDPRHPNDRLLLGYLKVSHDRIEKDPDRRIQEALALVFTKFAEMQTVRQVHLLLRRERIALPAVSYGPEGRHVEWKLPVYNTIHHT